MGRQRKGIRSMIVSEMNRPWGESRTCDLRQMRTGLPYRRACGKGFRRGGNGEAGPQCQAPGGQARSACMKRCGWQRCGSMAVPGCHMSLLDIDEAILNVARRVEVVYGPLVDARVPKFVDVTLAKASQFAAGPGRDPHHPPAHPAGRLGRLPGSWDIAAMRNQTPDAQVLERVYVDGARATHLIPTTAYPPCCAKRCLFTSSSKWISTCPAARLRPKPSPLCSTS